MLRDDCNQWSCAFDLSQPRAREIAKEIVKRSDVVVENFGSGVRTSGAWADPLVAVTGAFAVLAALHHPQRTREGQHVDFSMMEATLCGIPDALDLLLGQWTATRTRDALMHELQVVGVPAGPSMNAAHLLGDPPLQERGAFVEVDSPAGQRHLTRWRRRSKSSPDSS